MSDVNYNLLQEALRMGGRVVRSVDLTTGEIAPESAEVSCVQDTAPGGAPLSKSHIRPRGRENVRKSQITYKIDDNGELLKVGKEPSVSWFVGSSILKTSQGSDGSQVGGGVRKSISGFSSDSRRRLMYSIASIRRDAELPCFVTLTYPNEFPSPKESKRHLKMFNQRLQRAFSGASAIWKLEPQERGAPHYHLLVWGVPEHDLFSFVINAWFEIAGNQVHNHLLFHMGLLGNQKCVNQVRSWRGVWSYASKYLGKTFEVAGWDNLYTGRFWGYVNRELIPFGEFCEEEASSSQVFHVMRYQRRFSKRKIGNKGFTLFCDADQWIKNIFREVQEAE